MSRMQSGLRYVPTPWRMVRDASGKIIKGFCPVRDPEAEPTTVFNVPISGMLGDLIDCARRIDNKVDAQGNPTGLQVSAVLGRLNGLKKAAFTMEELGMATGYNVANPITTALNDVGLSLLGLLARSGRITAGGQSGTNKQTTLETTASNVKTASLL